MPENIVFVSIISLWEIVIKQRLNKLDFSADVSQMMSDVQTMNAQLLGLEPRHLQALEALESPPDHKDPFDRLLISQALADNLSIIASDKKISAVSSQSGVVITEVHPHIKTLKRSNNAPSLSTAPSFISCRIVANSSAFSGFVSYKLFVSCQVIA